MLANLIPAGVGSAIRENSCPKVYVPNLGVDPEQYQLSLDASVKTLLRHLEAGVNGASSPGDFLNFVLLDRENGNYSSSISTGQMRELGIEVIDVELVSKKSAPYYDNELLSQALLSLA